MSYMSELAIEDMNRWRDLGHTIFIQRDKGCRIREAWVNEDAFTLTQDYSEAGDYAAGYTKPHYPVPVTELDSALAATPERVSFLVKSMLLNR